MSERLRINLLFALTCLIWGSTWLAIKIGLTGIPPLIGAGLRFVLAGALLFGIAAAMRLEWPKSRRFQVLVAVQALLNFSINYGLVYYAELTVPSGLASVLFATMPLFIAVIGTMMHMERLNFANVGGLVAGFGGVASVYWSEVVRSSHVGAAGVFAMLGSPAAAAVTVVLTKRWGADIHPVTLFAPSQLIGGFVQGAIGLLIERGQPLIFNAATIGSVLYLVIFGSAIAFWAFFSQLQKMPATRLSLNTYITPVVALLLGTLVAHEQLEPRTYLGIALVLVGIWLVHVKTGGADA